MRVGMFIGLLWAAVVSSAAACSNAVDGDTGLPGQDAASSAEASQSAPESSTQSNEASTTGGETSVPMDDAGTGATNDANVVVINEISGKGADWVELYNAGSTALDMSGYALADTEKEAGGPSLANAVTFPSGTILSPNAYMLVVELTADASASSPPACPGGGQSYCFGCTWGISNKDGETLYVLDSQESIRTQASYPANAVDGGETWGRLPNGTGGFAATKSTPGTSNLAE